MRRCLVILLAVGSLAAAPGPTEAYLAARDDAMRAALHPTPADEARAPAMLAALDPLIAAAVGPIAIEGFPPTGTSNADTLSPDMGYGRLDGIRLASGAAELLVSTRPLLRAWLRDGRFWSGTQRPRFGSAGFVFAALRPDAGVTPTMVLPVGAPPAGGDAAGLLFQYAQDDVGASPPDRVAVSVRRGDRVYLFVTAVTVAAVPACTAAYTRDAAAVEALLAAYRTGGAKDAALFARATRASGAASGKAQACIGAHLRGSAAWAGLVGTARRLAGLTGP